MHHKITEKYNTSTKYKKIAILGSGAWGSAIAHVLSHNSNEIILYGLEKNFMLPIVQKLLNTHINIKTTTNINDIANTNIDLFVISVPAQIFSVVSIELNEAMQRNKSENDNKNGEKNTIQKIIPIIIASKGIENHTHKFMSEILTTTMSSFQYEIAVLSGPNFACEVINNEISISNIACKNKDLGEDLAKFFTCKTFKTTYIDDVIGAQLCASVKNVYAILNGIVSVIHNSENTQAAIMLLIINELKDLIIKFGGSVNTIFTAAGIGDLLLTCTNETSRNMSFGKELASGNDIDELLKVKTIEGYYTTKAIYELCQKYNFSAPAIEAIYSILYFKQIPEINIDNNNYNNNDNNTNTGKIKNDNKIINQKEYIKNIINTLLSNN